MLLDYVLLLLLLLLVVLLLLLYDYDYLARSRLCEIAQVHPPVELRLPGPLRLPPPRRHVSRLGRDSEGEDAARLCEQLSKG